MNMPSYQCNLFSFATEVVNCQRNYKVFPLQNMNRFVKSCCGNVQNYFQYFFIAQGLTAYWYDESRGKFQRNILSRATVFLAHSVGVALLLHLLFDSLELFKGFDDLNPLLIVVSCYKYVQGVLVIFTVIHIWRYDEAYTKLKQRIFHLERDNGSKLCSSNRIESNFRCLAYLKYGIISYLYLAILLVSYGSISYDNYFLDIPLIFCYAHTQILPYMVLFQYFQMIWKLCRCFHNLDITIAFIAQEAVKSPCHMVTFDSSLYELLQLHTKLCHCLIQMQQIFKLEMFVCRSNILISNTIAAYYIFMFTIYIPEAVIVISVASVTYLFHIVDLYINDYIGDMNSYSFEEIILKLREFNGGKNLGWKLEKVVSENEIVLHPV